ncbi:MAG: 3-oxoacid CoA-transferase subunit B [Thermodesulfobacteriota bacterium]
MSEEERIAQRAAREVRAGQIINLGIGIPALIPGYLPGELPISIHSENGILGMGLKCSRGSEDRNLINAGGNYVTVKPGAAFFDSVLSFALVRGGRLDIAFLGALEVSKNGDLANWIIPGKFAPGIGGGMELAQKARRVIVTTTHTTKRGEPKIIEACTLPLTARACVDTIISELAVMDVVPEGLLLRELAQETDLATVAARTAVRLLLPSGEIPRF